jgi:hypothetical protein
MASSFRSALRFPPGSLVTEPTPTGSITPPVSAGWATVTWGDVCLVMRTFLAEPAASCTIAFMDPVRYSGSAESSVAAAAFRSRATVGSHQRSACLSGQRLLVRRRRRPILDGYAAGEAIGSTVSSRAP